MAKEKGKLKISLSEVEDDTIILKVTHKLKKYWNIAGKKKITCEARPHNDLLPSDEKSNSDQSMDSKSVYVNYNL